MDVELGNLTYVCINKLLQLNQPGLRESQLEMAKKTRNLQNLVQKLGNLAISTTFIV